MINHQSQCVNEAKFNVLIELSYWPFIVPARKAIFFGTVSARYISKLVV